MRNRFRRNCKLTLRKIRRFVAVGTGIIWVLLSACCILVIRFFLSYFVLGLILLMLAFVYSHGINMTLFDYFVVFVLAFMGGGFIGLGLRKMFKR